MELEYSIYTLKAKRPLNRFGHTEKKGVLIRVDQRYYLDYFPWEEFGDKSVENFLAELKRTKVLPSFLLRDLVVEKDKNNIEHQPFKNHFFGDTKNRVCKLKFLNDLDLLENQIIGFRGDKIRIDFNGYGEKQQLISFWDRILDKRKIDYFEDFGAESDQFEFYKCGIPIASDRFQFVDGIHKLNIVKPNRDEINVSIKNQVFSSYMGHSLGVYHCFLHLMKSPFLDQIHGIIVPEIYIGQDDIFKTSGNKYTINEDRISDMYNDLKKREWEWIS